MLSTDKLTVQVVLSVLVCEIFEGLLRFGMDDFLPISVRKIGRPRKRLAVLCRICQKPFEALPCEVARGAGRYCSALCRDEAVRQRVKADIAPIRERQPSEVRICETCQREFRVYPYRANPVRSARFCSRACYSARKFGS